MTINDFTNGSGRYSDPFAYELDEPIHIKGFSVTYDRKFNLGNFESLTSSVTIWIKTNVPEGETFDLPMPKSDCAAWRGKTCGRNYCACKTIQK